MSETMEAPLRDCVECSHRELNHDKEDAHCLVEDCDCKQFVAPLAEDEDPDGPVVPQA